MVALDRLPTEMVLTRMAGDAEASGLEPEVEETSPFAASRAGDFEAVLEYGRREPGIGKEPLQQALPPRIGQCPGPPWIVEQSAEGSHTGWPGTPEPVESLSNPQLRRTFAQSRVERLFDQVVSSDGTQMAERGGDVGAADSVDDGDVSSIDTRPFVDQCAAGSYRLTAVDQQFNDSGPEAIESL